MTKELPCPCASTIPFSSCCEPILKDQAKATTAEQLMRSRYAAFVKKDTAFIRRSWHEKSRPRSLNFEDHPVVWLGLEVHTRVKGQASDSEGQVEFTSTYLENGMLCFLRETSDFVKENNLWYYLRGECEVTKEKPRRNTPCPCGSTKKFKRCCLQQN